jgi:hypothetical protein
MRKTRRSKGRNAKFFVINVTLAAEQPTKYNIGEGHTKKQRNTFRTLL